MTVRTLEVERLQGHSPANWFLCATMRWWGMTKRRLAGLQFIAGLGTQRLGRRSSHIYLTHQLFTNVQVADHAFRDARVAFEHEALPWIDDVYRFALSLT